MHEHHTPYTERDLARFWSRVEKTETCWWWRGSTKSASQAPYGRFWAQGKQHSPHRVMWEITYGPIPDGLEVGHECDHPRCVRPECLKPLTHQENVAEIDAKGRRPRGADLPFTKLTDEQVAELRARYHRPSYHESNINQLAEEYGITRSHAKRIVSGARR
jgi:hypothetical protein